MIYTPSQLAAFESIFERLQRQNESAKGQRADQARALITAATEEAVRALIVCGVDPFEITTRIGPEVGRRFSLEVRIWVGPDPLF